MGKTGRVASRQVLQVSRPHGRRTKIISSRQLGRELVRLRRLEEEVLGDLRCHLREAVAAMRSKHDGCGSYAGDNARKIITGADDKYVVVADSGMKFTMEKKWHPRPFNQDLLCFDPKSREPDELLLVRLTGRRWHDGTVMNELVCEPEVVAISCMPYDVLAWALDRLHESVLEGICRRSARDVRDITILSASV